MGVSVARVVAAVAAGVVAVLGSPSRVVSPDCFINQRSLLGCCTLLVRVVTLPRSGARALGRCWDRCGLSLRFVDCIRRGSESCNFCPSCQLVEQCLVVGGRLWLLLSALLPCLVRRARRCQVGVVVWDLSLPLAMAAYLSEYGHRRRSCRTRSAFRGGRRPRRGGGVPRVGTAAAGDLDGEEGRTWPQSRANARGGRARSCRR